MEGLDPETGMSWGFSSVGWPSLPRSWVMSEETGTEAHRFMSEQALFPLSVCSTSFHHNQHPNPERGAEMEQEGLVCIFSKCQSSRWGQPSGHHEISSRLWSSVCAMANNVALVLLMLRIWAPQHFIGEIFHAVHSPVCNCDWRQMVLGTGCWSIRLVQVGLFRMVTAKERASPPSALCFRESKAFVLLLSRAQTSHSPPIIPVALQPSKGAFLTHSDSRAGAETNHFPGRVSTCVSPFPLSLLREAQFPTWLLLLPYYPIRTHLFAGLVLQESFSS